MSLERAFKVLPKPISISIPPENRLGMRAEILQHMQQHGNSAFLVTGVALATSKKPKEPNLDHFILELKTPPPTPTHAMPRKEEKTFYVTASKVRPRQHVVPFFLSTLATALGLGLMQ